MQRDPKAYLYDIKEAAENIKEFTKGMSLEDYCNNELVKAAVERKFAIIGEVLMHLRDEYPELLKRRQFARIRRDKTRVGRSFRSAS